MREHFIPVRKSDIAAALLAEPRLADDAQHEAFRQLCRLLGSVFHYEHFEELERLKDAYFYFSPEVAGQREGEAPGEAAYRELVDGLVAVLVRANFTEIAREEVDRAHRERAILPVEVHTPTEDYRDIRFFRRGRHREKVELREWFGLHRRTLEVEVYDHVVLVAAVKPPSELAAPPPRKRRRRPRRLRGGAVLIKYFRDIASADLNTLLPDVRVIMNPRDMWLLGVPALVGGIPLLLKLVPTVALLLLLVGIRFGYEGAREDDDFKQALAVMTGLIALGSFVFQQWIKYKHQALRYQLEINDNIYFRNLNNNAGIFDYLIGAAEEQEYKEALLAYFFLMGEPLDERALDTRIEAWLDEHFKLKVDFEVKDGLAKLERLGLLTRNGATLSVPPLSEALARLDRRWDGLFRFSEAAE